MAYLDSSGQDTSPSFLQSLAQALGMGGAPTPPPNRAALASALAGQAPAPAGTHYAQLPGPPLLLANGGDIAAASAPTAAPIQRAAPISSPATPVAPPANIRGSIADIPQSGTVAAPTTVQPQSIVVPGYEAKGPLTRAQVVAASDDDKTMPAEEDWDAAAKARGVAQTATSPAQPPVAPAANQYTEALKTEYSTAMAGHDAEMAAARSAAAGGTQAGYELAKGHLATADRYLQLATAAQAKYDETLKPGTRTLTDAELTPAEREAGGEWQQSATGERSQVGGTEADTTRAPNAEESARLVSAGQNPKLYQVSDGKLEPIAPGKPANTEIVHLPDGTLQTVNKETGELIGAPIGKPNADGKLTQAAIDELADRARQGDQSALTGLGYGKMGAANRAAVANRTAELMIERGEDPTAIVRNIVGLSGEKAGARTMGQMGARINTFAEEAKQTGGMALQASEALPREAWVPIEKIIQMGESATNNPKLSELQAANNAFANTYSKAVNPSGVPTDEGRRAAFSLLNVAKNPEAYAATVRQLQREMDIVQNAISQSRATQLYGGEATPSVPAPRNATTQGATTPPSTLPPGAKQAPDGHFYVPDPSRPGKYLQVQP